MFWMKTKFVTKITLYCVSRAHRRFIDSRTCYSGWRNFASPQSQPKITTHCMQGVALESEKLRSGLCRRISKLFYRTLTKEKNIIAFISRRALFGQLLVLVFWFCARLTVDFNRFVIRASQFVVRFARRFRS